MALKKAVFPVKFETATMQDYEAIMEDAPPKFDAKSAAYRLAKGEEGRCDECVHLFARHLDGSFLCEIVRPVPEVPIWPEFTCKFFTEDGEKFPLYKR